MEIIDISARTLISVLINYNFIYLSNTWQIDQNVHL